MRALWLALIAGMVAGSAGAQTGTPSVQIPADQSKLIAAVTKAKDQQEKATTDFQRGAVRPTRGKDICSFLKSKSVNGWVGKITDLSTNSDGSGIVAIEIGDDVHVKTWNNALSDIGSNTLIKPDTKLFQSLGELSEGDIVKFSGSFFGSKVDCIQESSLTLNGSIDSPEYIFKFKTIAPY